MLQCMADAWDGNSQREQRRGDELAKTAVLAVGNDEQQWCEWQQNLMMWTPVDASYHKVWDCPGPNSCPMPPGAVQRSSRV